TLQQLREGGKIIWANRRYGATYAIDELELRARVEQHTPVIHLGQPEAVMAVLEAEVADWVVVELWCPRDIAEKRARERGTGDLTARMEAWDETERLSNPDLRLDTSLLEAGEAARLISARSTTRSHAQAP